MKPHCTTIPAESPFLATLARWILAQYSQYTTLLPKVLVLLPSRRACRSLREALLEVTGGQPLLLPRIQPIGDIDEGMTAAYYPTGAEIPPAIAPMRRELLLTRLVMGFGDKEYTIEQAADLARRLAQFIDDVAREGLSFDGLQALVPEDLAGHWQETVDFLKIISQRWPEILIGEGVIDPALHRNLLLTATAEAWKKHPPAHPVIAAGSTGSIPATAALLSVIARLPEGMVVLPALDCDMPEDEWKLIAETHPQFGLKQLIETMGCKRSDIQNLAGEVATGARNRCLRAILQPPESTADWTKLTLPLVEGLAGVQLLIADTLLDEARMIAVALREALETPEKTAALVTPDRQLARMAVAQMKRFGIAIDDSAGTPLMDTPPGCFLRLVADMVATYGAPAPLLALLRHPLAAAGMEPAECRKLSRILELQLLRGVRRAPGLAALAAATDNKWLQRLLTGMAEHARALSDYFERRKPVSLSALLSAHMALAEWLATTEDEPGAARLWAGEAGNQLAAFLAELLQQGDVLEQVDPLAYPGLFETLIARETYRPHFGLHPRLHILSPIEARLQQFDLVILGSLNEGTWPALPDADPWMSRPMRNTFGLPAAERAIGQSAQDLNLLCAAPGVLLSRARKVEGAPTVPSRWLVRLETLVKGLDTECWQRLQANNYFEQAKQLLDTPIGYEPLTRPEPQPPFEARPRKLRVTAVDNWLRDPYMIYAKYILKLDKLDPLDEEPDAADFGSLVHKALDEFTRAAPQILPENALEILLACGRDAFSKFIDRPAVASLWWPRFEAMAAWFIDTEKERRGAITRVLSEIKGEWHFHVDDKPFTLTTSIDRIEIGLDGALTLIDFKTGTVPTQGDIDQGLANQLPLEALIALNGNLESAIPKGGIIGNLEYWKLSGNHDQCEIKSISADGIEAAKYRLEDLIRRYDNPVTPYSAETDPTLKPRYSDYEHLTRRDEWEAV